MTGSDVRGYSPLQVGLHWVIALLVLFQLVFGESMSHAQRGALRGTPVSASDAALATAHYWVGIAILILVLLRLALRLTRSTPRPLETAGRLAARLASAAHVAFYVLLVAVPVTGLLAIYVSRSFGGIHELGKPAFIVLIALHAAAALYHQFWLRDGTLRRMVVPGAP
ncbi:cytochrome b [Kaistia sp. 32K]|uniref:cytochrome b n=1 Tax=Kaistia sp. 32K TaxID=2795690 RepID=UPI001914FC61|nr:cytochrome b/b6 domain-containing protein [Kaistia sp. 32K]BCP55042.1 cytochrome b [Kaistia sp. 32K]